MIVVVPVPSRLLSRLWVTLERYGIRLWLSPKVIEREGRARNAVRADEIRLLAQAQKDRADILAGRAVLDPVSHLPVRVISGNEPVGPVEPVLLIQTASEMDSLKREENVSKALILTEDLLAEDPDEPTEHFVDENWLRKWREGVADVSSEELRELWARALAGEIKAPGSYSLRTLLLLTTLTRVEADEIARLLALAFDDKAICAEADLLDRQGFSFERLLEFEEMGLLIGTQSKTMVYSAESQTQDWYSSALSGRTRCLVMSRADRNDTFDFQCYKLTRVARELARLGTFPIPEDYIAAVGLLAAKAGFDVEIGDIKRGEGTRFEVVNRRRLSLAPEERRPRDPTGSVPLGG